MKLDAKLTNQASVTASRPDFHTTCIHHSGMLLWRRNARLCFLRGFSASADNLIRMFNPLSGDDRRGSSSSMALSGASARAMLIGLVEKGAAGGGGNGRGSVSVDFSVKAELTDAAVADAVASVSRGRDAAHPLML